MGAEQQPVRSVVPRKLHYEGSIEERAQYLAVKGFYADHKDEPMTLDSRKVIARHEYPQFHHFPEDPTRAEYYYFNEQGEIIPTPEKLTAIARNMLTSFFEPKGRIEIPQEGRKLSLVYGGEQTGLRMILEEAKRLAIEEYGVPENEIMSVDHSPTKERERLKKLEELRMAAESAYEAGDKTSAEAFRSERENFLNEIKEEELNAIDRVEVGGMLIMTETNPQATEGFDPIDVADLKDARQPARIMRIKDERRWMVSSYPHQSTVDIDREMNPGTDLTLEVETYEWLLACERPLAEVLGAQEKLRKLMNSARQVRVVANAQKDGWQTDVTFPITKNVNGQDVPRWWFNHAGFEHNFPGSEVYGSPLGSHFDRLQGKEIGGNGTISYPYPVMFDGTLLPNLTVHVVNGKVETWEIRGDDTDSKVTRAREKFEAVMKDDENPGNRFFGEIGIGTSPYPTFNTSDIGFNEKRTGVHFALGKCYTGGAEVTDEAGNAVDLDNGNEPFSNIHADLVLPSSNTNPVDMWVDIGTADEPRWVLALHNGAFVEQVGSDTYRADPSMKILSAPDAFSTFKFEYTLPPVLPMPPVIVPVRTQESYPESK